MSIESQYAQGRIDTLACSLLASGLTVRQIAWGAGVSKETAFRAIRGEGIQAFNFFKIENFIMNYYTTTENKALIRAAERMAIRIEHNKSIKPNKAAESPRKAAKK